MTRKLVLLRHGQSQWNLENRFTGWVDVDLTDTGEAQAHKGGELIATDGADDIRALCDDCTVFMPTSEPIVGREAVYLTRPLSVL